MKSSSVLAVLLLTVALPERSVSQNPAAPGPADPQFQQKVSDLGRNGEQIKILNQKAVLKPFSTEQVESLLFQGNRYIRAIAALELKERGARGQQEYIRRAFRQYPLVREARFDPHGLISPDTAVLLAYADYLATLDKASFVPALLDRPEVWNAPPLFASSFRQLGAGWIQAALPIARADTQKAALSYLISAAATPDNLNEVAEVIRKERSIAWGGAVLACERLNAVPCWQALEGSLADRDESERLLARMSQFRQGRTTQAALYSAAERVALRATSERSASERTRLLLNLNEFLGLCRYKKLAITDSLAQRLRETGSSTIIKALSSK